MIVVDTEFTSLDFNRGGLWQIGAIDISNPGNTFLEEARLEDGDFVEQSALDVVGKTEEELRDSKRQSQKEMLEHFFQWAGSVKIKNIIAQGPWDFAYLLGKANKYGLKFPLHHRSFDLHSIAQARYIELKGEMLIDVDHSDMGLNNVLKFCGLDDPRRRIGHSGEVIQEGSAHNALEDAKLEAECFSRLIYGRNLLPEFKKFPVPAYLENDNL